MQRLKTFVVLSLACLFWIATWLVTPPASAITQIKLSELDYHNCPPEFAEGAVTSWGISTEANCFIITGKAQNPTGKTVYDADVYGRIYDANHNSIVANRSRVGSIEEVPPGVSDFEFRISVPANQPTPLQLEQFKASGFTGKVRPSFGD